MGYWSPAGGGQWIETGAVANTNVIPWVGAPQTNTGTTIGQATAPQYQAYLDQQAPPPPPPPPGGGPDPNAKPQWLIDWENEQARLLNQRRESAYSTLYSMFKTWGIDVDGNGLAAQVKSWIWADKSDDEVIMLFRGSDAYAKRFTGQAALVKRGQFMSEADYIATESAMRNVMNSWAIPKGFYDDYSDFGSLIGNGVSVKEVDDRVKSAQTFLDANASSEYTLALKALGIDNSGLLAYVLDGDRAQSIIQKQMKSAAMAGAANQFGFEIDAAEAAKYGATLGEQFNSIGIDQRMTLEATLSKLGDMAKNDERLAYIDTEQYQREDALDAELLNDSEKRLASQRRGLREAARFSGSSGVTTGSLSRNSGA